MLWLWRFPMFWPVVFFVSFSRCMLSLPGRLFWKSTNFEAFIGRCQGRWGFGWKLLRTRIQVSLLDTEKISNDFCVSGQSLLCSSLNLSLQLVFFHGSSVAQDLSLQFLALKYPIWTIYLYPSFQHMQQAQHRFLNDHT